MPSRVGVLTTIGVFAVAVGLTFLIVATRAENREQYPGLVHQVREACGPKAATSFDVLYHDDRSRGKVRGFSEDWVKACSTGEEAAPVSYTDNLGREHRKATDAERELLHKLGWAAHDGEDWAPPLDCWHHPFFNMNDPFTTDEALEASASSDRQRRLERVVEDGDWACYEDEYDQNRLSREERHERARKAFAAWQRHSA